MDAERAGPAPVVDVEHGNAVDYPRLGVFLAFAFGIAWATSLIIYATGGLVDSPPLVPGTPVTVALVLVATLYMWSPAAAHMLTRIVTREGWSGMYLRPRLKRSWKVCLAAWFGPALLTFAGAIVFFVLFPGFFDPSLSGFRERVSGIEQQSGEPIPLDPAALAAIQIVSAVLLAPAINSLLTFGEEFGWRAYLQPRLMPIGTRRALVVTGVIWGVWHWPIIAMGHNYGLDYPGHPWLGMLAMVWFTVVVGTVIGWLAIVSKSLWPAVIAHASVNATAGVGVIFSSGNPSPLIGPLPVGVVGSIAWALAALYILWRLPGLS